MLVLSRVRNEKVMYDFSDATDEELLSLRDSPIETLPVDVRGDKVQLGVTAPKFVRVDREEVYKARRAAKGRVAVPTPAETREATEAAIKRA